MILDYREMQRLIQIRMKQIDQVSLEMEYFNREYKSLSIMRNELGKLLVLERADPQDLDIKPEQEE